MKKIFLAAVMVFTAFCASAQINVLKNGMTLFGYTPSTLGLTLTKSSSSITDSVSTSLNHYVFNYSTFSDDSIASAIFYGRDLKISAQEVKLGAGFSIEKGGEMSISPRESNL
jgi:hypothetical protein